MSYTKDITIDGVVYNYRFDSDRNSDYKIVIISKDGLPCGKWSEINYDNLTIILQDIIDYIKLDLPYKFCVISENVELFNFYKEKGVQLKDFYTCREKELIFPIKYFALYYDRI